jgi:hypothetical protein
MFATAQAPARTFGQRAQAPQGQRFADVPEHIRIDWMGEDDYNAAAKARGDKARARIAARF